jgi:hypothetical protein
VARPPTLPVPREELKMVLCVNHSLGMGKGKIGAWKPHRNCLQQTHAALWGSRAFTGVGNLLNQVQGQAAPGTCNCGRR